MPYCSGDTEWAAPRFGKFEPYAVKHQVADWHQVDRTHPLFFSVQETFESWTRSLTELQPREAYVRVGNRTGKIKAPAVQPPRATPEQIDAIIDEYARILLVSRADLESDSIQSKAQEPRVKRSVRL